MKRLFAVFGLSLCVGGAAFAFGDAPEISRSPGRAGGVVVLWTRVVPASDDAAVGDIAAKLQARLGEYAAAAVPGAAIDVRPAPERACPAEKGCRAASVGALLVHQDNGCAVVAVVSAPGRAAGELHPWAGRLTTASPQVAFRNPPEKLVKIQDFAPCDQLAGVLDERKDAIVEAIAKAAATPMVRDKR